MIFTIFCMYSLSCLTPLDAQLFISDTYTSENTLGLSMNDSIVHDVITVQSVAICADECTQRGIECLTFSVTSREDGLECRLSRRSSLSSAFVSHVDTMSDVFSSKGGYVQCLPVLIIDTSSNLMIVFDTAYP